MGVRPHTDIESRRRAVDKLERQLARAYLVWLIGIIVGAIQLRPEKVEVGGIAYIVENPDVLQGIIFVACFVYYVAISANLILFGIENTIQSRPMPRRMIYAALGNKPTLEGRGKDGIRAVKLSARVLLSLSAMFVMFYYFLPLLHILIFEQTVLFKGVDAIFHTMSVQNNKIVLNSVPVAVATFCVLAIWTRFLSGRFKKTSSSETARAIFVNGLSATSFAFADHFIRGQEDLETTLIRVGTLQFIIFSIYVLRVVSVSGVKFFFWSILTVKYWRLRRSEAKLTNKNCVSKQ